MNVKQKLIGKTENTFITMDKILQNYVLDSFALLAYFNGETGAPIVQTLIEKAFNSEIILYISDINLGEVYYITYRNIGEEQADSLVLKDIPKLPINIHYITHEDVISAAKIKAQYPISFCDAFAASLTKDFHAICVTGDPEFDHLANEIAIEWLPR